MQIFRGIESIRGFGATTVAVGSFDGVHSGHSSLLKELRERAHKMGRKSLVVSFSPHPRVTLQRAEGLSLLTSDTEKAELLRNEGIDALLLVEFNEEFSKLSYEEFLVEILQKQAGMAELIVGFNNHMGHNSGGYDNLKEVAQQNNFEITLVQEFGCGSSISSTTIRNLIEQGDLESANKLLGHPYLIIGECDSSSEVKLDNPLKLTPSPGRYLSEINGEIGSIVIDQQRRIWCEASATKVIIKIEKRYEEE